MMPAEMHKQQDQFETFKAFLISLIRENTLDGMFKACETFFFKQPENACACIWLVNDWLKRPITAPPGEHPAGQLNGQPDDPPAIRKLTLFKAIARTQTEPQNWEHADGTYAGISFQEGLIGRAAGERKQFNGHAAENWHRPAWAEKEAIVEYMAAPMIFDKKVIGVFAVFLYDHDHTADSEGVRLQRILADSLAAAISNAKAYEAIGELRNQLKLENEYLREEVRQVYPFGPIIGDSDALHRVIEQVEQVAPTEASVLITGESGTGKELIARSIHEGSKRSERPFIKVNCAAIPQNLFESEFFGHVRGAFTGAVKNRMGRFQLADRGTLLLDEVAEIPPDLQGKLLRVLQERHLERIGDERTIHVSVRIIAATNRNLADEVKKGRFRQDLYYRLAVFPIELPALRERPEDIYHLAQHFIQKICRKMGLPGLPLTRTHLAALQNYDWPGNVRELQNVIERAVIISKGRQLNFDFLHGNRCPSPVRRTLCLQQSGPEALKNRRQIIKEHEWVALQRQNILAALEQSQWKIQGKDGAADLLGLKATTLRSRIKALNLSKENE